MFKKFIVLMFLLCVSAFAQPSLNTIRQDDSTLPTNAKHRYGTVIAGKGSDGKYHIFSVDSDGNLVGSDAPFTESLTDTSTVSTTDVVLTFATAVDYVSIFCDDLTKPFWIGIDQATSDTRCAAGAIVNLPVAADSIAVKLESGSAVVTATGYQF
jgi:hypothetical protein